MNHLNPSITSPRDGARGRNKSPLDLTGRRHEELLREKQAKDAAKDVDVNEVRRAEYLRGREDGYAKGLADGWDACIRALVAEGVLDPDEPGDEAAG